MKMTAGTDLSSPLSVLDGGFMSKDTGSSRSSLDGQDPDTPEATKQIKAGKPPRHLSVIRHCASTARLDISAESVCIDDAIQLFYMRSLHCVLEEVSFVGVGPRGFELEVFL